LSADTDFNVKMGALNENGTEIDKLVAALVLNDDLTVKSEI
jgi:hypothetical protein